MFYTYFIKIIVYHIVSIKQGQPTFYYRSAESDRTHHPIHLTYFMDPISGWKSFREFNKGTKAQISPG